MKTTFVLTASCLIMAACASSQPEHPKLPEDAPTEVFVHRSESFLRGVRGAYNTTPRGRDAAILDVEYTIECLSGGTPSARQRFKQASKILDEQYREAYDYYFHNPREKTYWYLGATKAIIDKTGCQVTGLQDRIKTTDLRTVLLYIIKYNIKPVQ